MKKTPY